MKKIFLLVLALSLMALPTMALDFSGFHFPPFTFFPSLTSVGGVVYDDVISGYKWGDWGLGGSYTIVTLDFSKIPYVNQLKFLTTIEFGMDDVVFQSCNATSYSAFYDLTPNINPSLIKVGLFGAIDTSNPNHYLAGACSKIGKFSF